MIVESGSAARGAPDGEATRIVLPDTSLVLDEIRLNQEAFASAARSRKRFIPLWRLRTQYRLIKANEPLWDKLGMRHPPMEFETAHGLSWAIVRRLVGAA